MLVIAMLLGNFGVIPFAAPAYGVVWSFLVPAAVPLLLLKANLRRIIPETGPMLGAYFLGVAGTLIGAVIGLWILPMGSAGPDLAGILSATYIGGSMNFAAVAEALEFKEAYSFNRSTCSRQCRRHPAHSCCRADPVSGYSEKVDSVSYRRKLRPVDA